MIYLKCPVRTLKQHSRAVGRWNTEFPQYLSRLANLYEEYQELQDVARVGARDRQTGRVTWSTGQPLRQDQKHCEEVTY